MKVILTGSTGFVGREVLEQCLKNSSITSVIALSRRELPPSAVDNPKLKVAIVKDFLSYPDSLLQDIKGAEACIWSLGQTPSKARVPGNDTARRVSVDYTLAAAKTFGQDLAVEKGKAKKFRFVYMSGGLAEREQKKPLWFNQEYRRIRGQVENDLIAHAKVHPDTFETYIMRPGMVLAKETNVKDIVRGLLPSVRVDVMASKMLDVALKGSDHQIFENTDIGQPRS